MLTTLKTLYIMFAARFKNESGATAIEYGLMVALIALVIAGTVLVAGEALVTLYESVVDCLESPNAC